jgi:MoaA/NifB/PqqE/SkfB family radical SAM enzyme
MHARLESVRRYLALAAAVRRARRRPFDPFKLTWIVTERCSLRCRTCHLWAGEPGAGPDLATCERLLDANRHLTWLNLSGGDVVERPDAPALMAAVATRLPDLALLDFPTAGQDGRATLAALEPLLDSDIPRLYVTVSLDGPDEVHDRVRRRRGAAAAARATFERLSRVRRKGFTAVVGMTLSRHNLPASAARAAACELAALLPSGIATRDLHLNLAHHSPHYYRNAQDVAPPAEAALALLRHVRGLAGLPLSPLGLVERRYWARARRYLRDGDPGLPCGALRSSVFLGADLTVHPCSLFDRPLGKLSDVGLALRRIPELPGARDALGLVEARRCPRCWSPCEAFPTLLLTAGTRAGSRTPAPPAPAPPAPAARVQ